MERIGGYTLQSIEYDIEGYLVHRASRVDDGAPFLAKTPGEEFPPLQEVLRLDHELQVLTALAEPLPGVLQPFARVDQDRTSYLILEHFSGRPVFVQRGQGLSIPDAVAVGRRICSVLDACHRRGIAHLRLSPGAILWDRSSGGVRLTHFGHATTPGGAAVGATPVDRLTLCSAPEQTGRVDHSVDHRADLYALGCILYYLLSGQFPLEAHERHELLYRLLAARPEPLARHRSDVPATLEDVVGRLLAKDPAQRPSSALEVFEELEPVLLEQRAAPPRGRWTGPLRFEAPALCGRLAELSTLRNAAEEALTGETRILRMSGPAGSGKSRLLSEFVAQLPSPPNLVLFGKFEQYRQAPYGAVLTALHGFVDQVLTGSETNVRFWRQRFAQIPESLRAVLVERVPRLQLLMGTPGPAAPLGPTETENRFHNAIDAFADALGDGSRPVVLIFDDCQWADIASLALMQRLFLALPRSHWLLVLAHRGLEGSQSPAGKILSQLADSNLARTVNLTNLTLAETGKLCDSVLDGCRNGLALADLLFQESRGNPLFVLELLRSFQDKGLLRRLRNDSDYCWEFIPPPAVQASVADNVLGLIVERTDDLTPACRDVLKAASCFGGDVSEPILATVTALEPDAFGDALQTLCAKGFLRRERRPGGRISTQAGREELVYRFVHDRVAQAARSLCDIDDVAHYDYEIGLALFAAYPSPAPGEAFEIVDHLNRVRNRLTPEQCRCLAELNVAAADAARVSVAYRTARALFAAALEALADWGGSPPGLVFTVKTRLAESSYLSAEFAEAERLFEELATEGCTERQAITLQRTRMLLYLHLQRYKDVIEAGLLALAKLGVRLPPRPSMPRLMLPLASVMTRARRLSGSALLAREDRSSERDRTVLDLLILLWAPTYWTSQPLNGLVCLKLIALTFRLGNTPQSPMAYISLAILYQVLFGRYLRALDIAETASRISAERSPPFVACRVSFLMLTFFGPLRRSNQDNVARYEAELESCLQSGEHMVAANFLDGISTSLPMAGFKLAEIRRRLEVCESQSRRIGGDASAVLIAMVRTWCEALSRGPAALAEAPSPPKLEHEAYSGVFALLRMSLHYLWGEDRTVLELARDLGSNRLVQGNPLHTAFFDLFRVLAECRAGATSGSTRPRLPAFVATSVKRLRKLSALMPENFRPTLLLAEAEVARFNGRSDAAVSSYRNAIEQAAALDHHLTHALACERLASLYETGGDFALVSQQIRIAAYSYERWGATAKVAQLAAAYPGIVSGASGEGAVATSEQDDIDAEAVMRASYAIAAETRSDRLSEKLLRVLATTAGAERALLVKESEGDLWIAAGWDVNAKARQVGLEPLRGTRQLAESVVRFVVRAGETLHLADAVKDSRFQGDPHIRTNRPGSIFCLPLMARGTLVAVLYLENGLTISAFGERQRKLVALLGHQAAIALNNADLHRSQLEALQAKVNPHLLYNALSTIAQLIVTDAVKAEMAVLKLAQLYRYMLTVSADQTVGLDEELRITSAYLILEQLRFGEKLDYEVSSKGDLSRVRVPALTVQPLVENCVKHGISPKLDGGRIRVLVNVGLSDCTIRVEDNGLGWGKGGIRGTGIGLKSVRQRLSYLFGSEGYALDIERGDGVVVTVTLPVQNSVAN